jgi:hypothetical protein
MGGSMGLEGMLRTGDLAPMTHTQYTAAAPAS